MNGSIIQAMASERVEVTSVDFALVAGESHGEVAECPVGRRKGGAPPVAHHGVDERIRRFGVLDRVLDLSPEVVRMGLSSVEAVELGRDHGRQQLPLHTTEM